MLLFVMVSASLKTGLFFDRDVYVVSIFLGLTCILITAGYKLSGHKQFFMLYKSPEFPLLIFAGIMLLIYTCHWMLGPLSMEGTGNEIIRWGLFGSVGLIAWIVSRERETGRFLRIIWHITGIILCGSALLTVYGLWDIPYGFFHTTDPALSATGTRLGGLMQYPNTFGSVMAAFLLERLFALPAALRLRRASFGAAAALLPLTPYTAALLLTESRGAWLAAALACAAGLAADRRRAAPIFAAAAAPVLGAALLYRQLAAAQLAPAVVPGLLWLAGLWAGGVLAGLMLCQAAKRSRAQCAAGRHLGNSTRSTTGRSTRHTTGSNSASIPSSAPATTHCPSILERLRRIAFGSTRRNNLIAATIFYIIAFIVIILPVKPRLLGETETVSARYLIYKDAWELFLSAPWFGQGGDTWRLSYRAIQSQAYVGAEVHSGYIDLLLNTGVIGFLFALILLFVTVIRLKVSCARLIPSFLVLVIHSAIDFDWSFGLTWLLIFWLPIMGGECSEFEIPQHPSEKRKRKLLGSFPLRKPTAHLKLWKYPVLMIGFSCITAWTVLGFSYWRANHDFEQALHTVNLQERKHQLKSALRWNPASTESALLLADFLPSKEAVWLMMNSLSHSPGHPELTWAIAEQHSGSEDPKQSALWYRISLSRDRHNAEKQTQAVYSLADMARKQWTAGKERAAVHTAYSALEVYKSYLHTVEMQLRNPHVRNDRDFRMTLQALREAERLESWIQAKNAHFDATVLNNSVFFMPLVK